MEKSGMKEGGERNPKLRKLWLVVKVVTVLGWCAAIASFVHYQQVLRDAQVALENQRISLPDQLQRIRDMQAGYVGKSVAMLDEATHKLEDLKPVSEELVAEGGRLSGELWQLGNLHKELLEHKEQLDAVYARLKQSAELPYESLEAMWIEHERLQVAAPEAPTADNAGEAMP